MWPSPQPIVIDGVTYAPVLDNGHAWIRDAAGAGPYCVYRIVGSEWPTCAVYVGAGSTDEHRQQVIRNTVEAMARKIRALVDLVRQRTQ